MKKKIYFFSFFKRVVNWYKLKKLKINGAHIRKIVIHGDFHIEGKYEFVEINENVHISEGVLIQAYGKVKIMNNVHLSYGSKLITCNLDVNTRKHICKPINYKRECMDRCKLF